MSGSLNSKNFLKLDKIVEFFLELFKLWKEKGADMTALLEEIIERLGNIEADERRDTGEAVQDGDHVVGVMSEGLKKLNALRHKFRQEAKGIALKIVAIENETGDEKHPGILKLRPAFMLAHIKRHAVEELFWDALRVEFPEMLSQSSVAIRKGWRVVWREEKQGVIPVGVVIVPVSPEEGPGFPAGPPKKDTLH